jgi:hypothetical protein
MKTQKPKQPRNDLAAAEARAAEKSRLAYRETPSRFTREEILARRDAAAYEAAGIAPALRTARDPSGNRGTPDPNDLSSRNARGETSADAYPREKASANGLGRYEAPPVGELPQPEDDTLRMSLAVHAEKLKDEHATEATKLDEAVAANAERSKNAYRTPYLSPWSRKR